MINQLDPAVPAVAIPLEVARELYVFLHGLGTDEAAAWAEELYCCGPTCSEDPEWSMCQGHGQR